MKATVSAVVGLSMSIIVSGCGIQPEPDARSSERQRVIAESVDVATEGTGYLHTFGHSKFRIGSEPSQRFELGFQKVVGSDGVFATLAETGLVMAIPNARAPSQSVAPLTESEEVHNKAVLNYFVAAGLPAEQVDEVYAHPLMHGSGSGSEPDFTKGSFDGYSSAIARVVAGLSVPDSFASARFNADGDVVEESVYWPTLPRDVVSQAKAFGARLADRRERDAYLGKLPPAIQDGQVVIRHSAGSERTPFEVAISYDVLERGEAGKTHHFDTNAREFYFASEIRSAPSLIRTPRRR